jgi:ABC-2 type transport system permease protein
MKSFIKEFGLLFKRLVKLRRYRLMILFMLLGSLLIIEVYNAQVVSNLSVAVIDFDNSTASRTTRQVLTNMREVTVYSQGINSIEQAQSLFESGTIKGILLIPSNFSSQLKQSKQAKVLAAVDMSNILVGKNVYKAFYSTISMVSAGIQLKVVKKLGEPKHTALSKVAPIAVQAHIPFNPFKNYSAYVVPGVLFLLLNIFILLLTCSVYRKPYKPSTSTGMLGAFVAIYMSGIFFGILNYFVLLPYAGIFPKSSFSLMATMLAIFTLVSMMMAIGLNVLINKPFIALEISVVVGMLSLMLAGITWPKEMFPAPLLAFSNYIPLSPFAKSFQTFLHYKVDWNDIRVHLMSLLYQGIIFACMIVIGLVIHRFIPNLKRKFKHD